MPENSEEWHLLQATRFAVQATAPAGHRTAFPPGVPATQIAGVGAAAITASPEGFGGDEQSSAEEA